MADYVLEGFKWGSSALGTASGEIDWSFATANLTGQFIQFDSFLTGMFQTEIREAFDRWESAANIDFHEVTDAAANQIRLGLSHIDGPNNIVGQEQSSYFAGSEIASDITFDMDEGWHLVNGQLVSNGGVSFYDVALHEIGHSLGLDHYNVSPAIMNAVVNPAVTDLTQSDIDGVRALYGVLPGIAVSTAGQLADGRLDFLQYNASGHLTGSALTQQSFWKVVGNVDFASNGNPAVITQSNGQIDLLNFSAGQLSSSLLMTGSYWDVKGAGLFSGAANAEFVSQSSNGQIDFLGFSSAGKLTTSALTSQAFWNVVGVADVNGDGHADVVTQSSSGAIDLLYFDNFKFVASALLPGNYDPILDVADMKNGSATILTESASGIVTELVFDGSHVTSTHLLDATGLALVHAAGAAGHFFA
ncbi:matrixin family metalloprotease [Bradyrhizobium sp. Pear76]|uniref:matrixin family metalloprotease n=1 Tax=Bradyrhizobium oropedii TaxID=1571201 RepID=UPI001E5CDE89|nr:matrixin family metalloprotease [Bradyrhizobium oropedii]MCC8965152.1 matrixin family metalloprotease [Bradyrhizobium oropedii]